MRRTLADLGPGATVLVACSGGADSLALLAATVFEGRKAGWRVVGACVDHGLQDGSAEHTARVVAQMAALGADETVSSRVSVEGAGLGPEAAARRARYAVLEEIGRHVGAAAIVLGHTRDDQAETVLLGLARGSGGRSLAGMRRAFDRYRRPLLNVARDDTVTACQVEGIAVWHDPHNADPAYTRVRVRTRLLPALEAELGPGVAATLARTADQLREDMDLLDDVAEAAYADLTGAPAHEPAHHPAHRPDHRPDHRPAPVALAVDGLAALPSAVRRRVLRLAALAAGSPGSELFHEHVVALDALVTDWHGQRWVDLPGPVRGTRRDGRIAVAPAPRPPETPEAPEAPGDPA